MGVIGEKGNRIRLNLNNITVGRFVDLNLGNLEGSWFYRLIKPDDFTLQEHCLIKNQKGNDGLILDMLNDEP